MSNFAAALLKHTEDLILHGDAGFWEKRAHRIASDPTNEHNAKVLARLENRVILEQGLDPTSIIDWFKQNWLTILQVVLAILPFLFMLAEPPPGTVEKVTKE
jgi:hypothetical protein